MTQNEYDTEGNIIMGGDFNCPLNPTLDKKGGVITPRYSVINSIENIKNTFSLHDIWRIKNPNTQSFTWSRCKPFIFCRLDFWLISDKLHDLVTNVDRLAAIKTDHSAIFLELEEIKESIKGPGFWKLNTSLLTNDDYVDMIKNELPSWIDEGNELSDSRSKWDWIKYNIRKSSIEFSKKAAKTRREKENNLNTEYQNSVINFQNNPCEDNKESMEKLKDELERFYENKVNGLIIRSRARWHEHGEKNSKYFLNLEKRNNIRNIYENSILVEC